MASEPISLKSLSQEANKNNVAATTDIDLKIELLFMLNLKNNYL
jgi:hypothetical protein